MDERFPNWLDENLNGDKSPLKESFEETPIFSAKSTRQILGELIQTILNEFKQTINSV